MKILSTKPSVTIILCGGGIDPRELPMAMQQANAMIPVNGRPVIGWILNDLLAKGLRRVVVVTRAVDISLHRFLERCYAERVDLTLARLYHPGSIVDSLQAGLEMAADAQVVRVVLGDTWITDPYDGEEDFAYTGRVEYADRWCLVKTADDGVIEQYLDKQTDADASLEAIAGYYHFQDGRLLRSCVQQAVTAGQRELSQVLESYGRIRPIRSRRATEWYDFGHLDKLAEARRRLLSSRSFNALRVDPVLHTVTKTSSRTKKLADELNWYLALPPGLQVLTPRILDHQSDGEHVQFTQEFYGYSSLAELFVFGDLSHSTWESILERVLAVHRLFCQHPGAVPPEDMYSMYYEKTRQRLDQLALEDNDWASLLRAEQIQFNGRPLLGFPGLLPRLQDECRELAATGRGTIIHGDFCFSNILFDLPNQIVRLLDPRGSFGRPGIYGDPRYDVAKLRHSVCGRYDFIVSDMFHVHQSGTQFDAKLFAIHPLNLTAAFDALVVAAGYDLRQIRLIEGLLFASMLPLHADRPDRQKLMFCHALQLLNEVLL